MSVLEITSKEDAWRLRCPNGHQVTPTNNHWYCHSCARWADDVEPELDEVIDKETGETVTREDVTLDFDVPGVYTA